MIIFTQSGQVVVVSGWGYEQISVLSLKPKLKIVKTQPQLNLTQLNSKQLYLTRVEVRHSSHVTHPPPHPHPQTFQPLLDMLGSWNLAQTLTRPT